MESELSKAMEQGLTPPYQALLPNNLPPPFKSLDFQMIQLDGDGLTTHLTSCNRPEDHTQLHHTPDENSSLILLVKEVADGIENSHILHATDKNVAKLLMTSMRDASLSGPALREAHHRVGWYLATHFLTEVLGVEDYSIFHVQGHVTNGFRIRDERQTTIVALMRGGESMALGVSSALPTAIL
jgi:hypothetical protein